MMRLELRNLMAAAAALVVGVATATAEPIRITSGSLVFPASPIDIAVELAGDGFAFTGRTGTQQIWLSPYAECLVPACVPGSTLSLQTVGSEATYIFATATYQGQAFDNFGGIDARSGLLTEWTGSLDIPSNFAGGSLSAPFSFAGSFRLTDDGTGSFQRVDLFGSGMATVTFGPYGPADPNAFGTQSVRFDFADAAPTPEPASLLLLATGLCGVAAASRRRTRA
jgi:PEP-CTERM motif